jgi:hypothetical protein
MLNTHHIATNDPRLTAKDLAASRQVGASRVVLDPRDGHGKTIEGWDRRSRLAYLPL